MIHAIRKLEDPVKAFTLVHKPSRPDGDKLSELYPMEQFILQEESRNI